MPRASIAIVQRPALLRFAALLATLPVAAPEATSAASLVGTASELKDALDAGAAHIIVTDHIDVTSLTPARTGPRMSDIRTVYFLNGGLRTLQSLRGTCDTEPPFDAPGWRAPQCVITTDSPLFEVTLNLPNDAWLDAIYVRYSGTRKIDQLLEYFPSNNASDSALWLSRIGFSGSSLADGIYTIVDTLLFDSTFAAMYLFGFGAGLGPAVTIDDCAFSDIGGDFAAVYSKDDRTAIQILSTTFTGNTLDVATFSNGTIYVDNVSNVSVGTDKTGVQPLSALAAASAFPTVDDNRFAAARAAADEAALAAGVGGDDDNTGLIAVLARGLIGAARGAARGLIGAARGLIGAARGVIRRPEA